MRPCIFVGIDLGTSIKRESTGLSYLVENKSRPWLESVPVHIRSDDTAIHSWILDVSSDFSSMIIGIDAPLSRPDHGTMRDCEKRMRKRGIACYPSGAKWVQDWVTKGIELKTWIENKTSGMVIEVYPYAARRVLDIGVHIKKKTKQGRHVIQEGLLPLIDGLDCIINDRMLSDDELDALLAAYTAYCVGNGTAVKFNGADGAIYIPANQKEHRLDEHWSK